MKILRLYIKEFKNLKDFEIKFTPEGVNADGKPIAFNSQAIIGQNGTGKSNLLEAIIIIFKDLDLYNKTEFSFEIDYVINAKLIQIKAEEGAQPDVKIDKKKSSAKYISENSNQHLPSNVFVYYSGKNQRIENLFRAHQNKFSLELRNYRDDLLRKLFYCRSGHSQIVLLACLLSQDDIFKQILEDLNIIELESALFVLKQPNRLKQKTTEDDIINGDERFWFASGTLVSEFLDCLWQSSVAPIDDSNSKEIDFRGRKEKQEQLYLFLPDKKALKKLGKLVGTPERFFRYAEGAYIGDLIDEIRITVKHKHSDGSITFNNLSEGEMQLLTVLGLMRITSNDNSLFLLDEPDTHLNPIWKLRYFDEIEKVTNNPIASNSSDSSQIIVTTHDPIMIGSLRKEQVRVLLKENNKISAIEPDVHPQGMGITGLLKSEMFGLSSTLDIETKRRLDRRNYLYALGRKRSKTENSELSRLSEELSDLGFAMDFKDPYFAMFVKKMALHTKFHKPTLTSAEQKEQDRIADEIIDEILQEQTQ